MRPKCPLQQGVTTEDKALLERLSHDYSYTLIPESADVTTVNTHKHALYSAYLDKSADAVKRLKRHPAGLEGQYTMTWVTVDHGKVNIVEAYFGDYSGSGKLQYVRKYIPEEIRLGYFDKDDKFIILTNEQIHQNEELHIAYRVASEKQLHTF